ncbi:hypothetical protein BU23DRAFT_628610 [Bimuria novae-zelandiae CBS 107.79]|uniref:Heterokaryon incompatibility domain-containing protein n=1 Tax=Bimuria novae-zelandiae CBS 107.79 TaxID=1447943 RepID=A0A6A5UKK4_9PLEO|nr:hypothetical protein BU23DRAFT_628610 [Bimuria novae-zelandiae CBS 107.79]
MCSKPGPVPLPKRVIEVPVNPTHSPRLLVTNDQYGEYVILPHCWGKAGIAKLTTAVAVGRTAEYQVAVPPATLPRSFADAIHMTRRLGYRSLWIDEICIVQDSKEDWAEEALKMALYHGRSALMISATAACDSNQGILVNRDVAHLPLLGKQRNYRLRKKLPSTQGDLNGSILALRA